MKTLILMRHAEAVDSSETDHARTLSTHGRLEAQRQATYLAHKLWPKPKAIIASDAVRTMATADIVATALEQTVQSQPELYQANANGYLTLVQQLPSDIDCTLIVGHNGGISEAISLLAGTPLHYLAPAGLAVLQVPTEFGWDALPGLFSLKELA